jgi:hypothetical protein
MTLKLMRRLVAMSSLGNDVEDHEAKATCDSDEKTLSVSPPPVSLQEPEKRSCVVKLRLGFIKLRFAQMEMHKNVSESCESEQPSDTKGDAVATSSVSAKRRASELALPMEESGGSMSTVSTITLGRGIV